MRKYDTKKPEKRRFEKAARLATAGQRKARKGLDTHQNQPGAAAEADWPLTRGGKRQEMGTPAMANTTEARERL